MSETFIGEVKIVPFGFAPKGWFPCDGRLLQISQYQAMHSILGNAFGGDGRTTFALPNLQGRIPYYFANGRLRGERGGEVEHTLSDAEIPTHSHTALCSNDNGDSRNPKTRVWSKSNQKLYSDSDAKETMHRRSITLAGGTQPHNNMPPYLAVNFSICATGVFPVRDEWGDAGTPCMGEITIFAGDYAPGGWALCNGQQLSIQGNEALFSVIDKTFGGDGKRNFALPDLRGRAPVHQGTAPGLTSRKIGETGGQKAVSLDIVTTPQHRHLVMADQLTANQEKPAGNLLGISQSTKLYSPLPDSNVPTMRSDILHSVGGNQPHNNMPPYLYLNFIIAIRGAYPPRD